jgi:hypothetical protein
MLILSMALKSGDYKSELHIPLSKVEIDPQAVVAQWLDFMQTGFRICATTMDATLAPATPKGDESTPAKAEPQG